MAKKTKDPNALPGRVYFGTSIMSSTQALVASLMGTVFMQYLTDYSGMGTYAATLGSAILVFARVFDTVNDPIEGLIIDRAKPGKNGKYRPFTWLAILLMTVAMIGLYCLPESITSKPIVVTIYIIAFYLMYDIGYSFFVPELIYRTITLDSATRGKLLLGPRMVVMLWSMVLSSLMAIVAAINTVVGNLHTAYGIAVIIFSLVAGLLSFLGTLCFKEKYIPEASEEEAAKITDILVVFKENPAFRVKILGALASGFTYTLAASVSAYYVKWAYCADLTTGEIDSAQYGTFSVMLGMIAFIPLILGTFLGSPIMKLLKSPQRASVVLVLAQGIPLGVLFVAQMLGILPNAPMLFFGALVILYFAMGASYIPSGVINLETMDYDVYTTGKQRPGLMNAATKLIEKAQTAFATAALGAVLSAVGYVVDSVSGNFVGDLSSMPTLLNWFAVLFGLIPFAFSLAFVFIYKKYPINDEIRAQMSAKLKEVEEVHE